MKKPARSWRAFCVLFMGFYVLPMGRFYNNIVIDGKYVRTPNFPYVLLCKSSDFVKKPLNLFV